MPFNARKGRPSIVESHVGKHLAYTSNASVAPPCLTWLSATLVPSCSYLQSSPFATIPPPRHNFRSWRAPPTARSRLLRLCYTGAALPHNEYFSFQVTMGRLRSANHTHDSSDLIRPACERIVTSEPFFEPAFTLELPCSAFTLNGS